jgi:hypothetical protein
MTAREHAEKYASREWQHIQDQIRAGLSPHVVTVAKDAYLAGYAQAIEDAAKTCEAVTEVQRDYAVRRASKRCADAIRALGEQEVGRE